MSSEFPLGFIYNLPQRPNSRSLGDHLAEHITDNGRVKTLIDCLSSTPTPAIWSPDLNRQPLTHSTAKQFIQSFSLPTSGKQGKPLGPNDRIMMALPTGPENALALMAVASYHTCAPVNASCTAGELKDDAVRLRAKAVVTTKDAIDRLELQQLHDEEGMEIIFIENKGQGIAGLFDMSYLTSGGNVVSAAGQRGRPSQPHGLEHQSLVLHTSGTSGKKKVVPYSLRHLIVGTCCVVQSWDLRPQSVNSEFTRAKDRVGDGSGEEGERGGQRRGVGLEADFPLLDAVKMILIEPRIIFIVRGLGSCSDGSMKSTQPPNPMPTPFLFSIKRLTVQLPSSHSTYSLLTMISEYDAPLPCWWYRS